jgi:ATP synthase F1 gamma subunit
VVDVLKGISAARYHVLEKQLTLFEQFFKSASGILNGIDVRTLNHPFLRPQTEKVSLIVITSDAGFLGGLNSQVINAGLSAAKGKGVITVIGEKGAGIFEDMHRSCTAFPGIDDTKRLSLAFAVRDHVMQQIAKGESGSLMVAFPNPISFSAQEIVVETLLPCQSWLPKDSPDAGVLNDPIWESKPEDIIEFVVFHWIGHRLSEIFALSRLAELSARVVHLEGSYQELLRRGKKLKLQYHKARHELIDRSIREIFSAQILYKQLVEAKN